MPTGNAGPPPRTWPQGLTRATQAISAAPGDRTDARPPTEGREIPRPAQGRSPDPDRTVTGRPTDRHKAEPPPQTEARRSHRGPGDPPDRHKAETPTPDRTGVEGSLWPATAGLARRPRRGGVVRPRAATTISAGVRPCGRRSQSGCRSPARRLDERRVDAWRVSRAATLADLRNWAPVAGIQVEYSLVERTADRELLPMAEALGLGAALWPPLGGGLLTGKYRRGTDGRLSDLRTLVHTESSDQKTAVVDTVLAVAEETGASPAQVPVAWLRKRAARATTSYVPIIGPRNTAQLEDYLGALEVDLTEDQHNRLTEVSAVPLGVPHEASAAVRDTVRGGEASVVTGPVVPVA